MAGGASAALNPSLVRAILLLMGLGLAAYIVVPPLYWHLAEALGRSSSSCPPCSCDCSSQPLLSLPEELSNVTFADCRTSQDLCWYLVSRERNNVEGIEGFFGAGYMILLSRGSKLFTASADMLERTDDVRSSVSDFYWYK